MNDTIPVEYTDTQSAVSYLDSGYSPNINSKASSSQNPLTKAKNDRLWADQLARAQKHFSDGVECVRIEDPRFPQILKDGFKRLNITEPNEFVAVPCGAPSNLAAVVLPFEKDAPEIRNFVTLNPMLSNSLITAWGKVAFLWMRIEGWRPANRALPGSLWISSGVLPTIVERVTTNGPARFQMIGDSIVTIKFSDLKWSPEIHELFLLERTEDQHGKLVQQVGPRKRVLNYRTAACFLAEALGVFFDKNNNCFQMLLPDQSKWEPVSKIKLNILVSSWLQSQAAKDPASFPVGDHVERVISRIKEIYGIERPGEPEGLKRYLCERLERRPGSNVTTREVFTSYFEFCKATGTPAYPKCVFLDVLPKAIREQFGLTKVHNVKRMHAGRGRMTARYGFNGLGIKTHVSAEIREAEEVREVPEGGIQPTSKP